MKKLLALLVTLVLVLASVPSSFAENIPPADIYEVIEMLELTPDSGFDYSNAIYNQKDNLLIMDVAIDGFAEYVVSAKQKGWTQYNKDWVEIKDGFAYLYSSTQEFLSGVGREDLKDILVLRLVNDDVVLRCDYSTASYSPLLIIRKGILVEDVMAR